MTWWQSDMITIFYFIPLVISLFFFTIIKIEDSIREIKVYSKDKFSYSIIMMLCFIPILNIIFALHILRITIISIKN